MFVVRLQVFSSLESHMYKNHGGTGTVSPARNTSSRMSRELHRSKVGFTFLLWDHPVGWSASCTNIICCFRRGRLAARCAAKYSSAPLPSPLICWYTQTPGRTPASTVAKASTRSPTWRNTPSSTQVGPCGLPPFSLLDPDESHAAVCKQLYENQ